jgi:hypothetical protein
MSQRRFFAACAAMILGVALLSANAAGQQTTLKQRLVGTWTFVRTEATQDGHFAQIQIADGIPKFASNSRVTGTPEENKAVVVGSISLFGTYTVDEAAKTIIYKVESSTFPNWAGQEQIRPIDSITSDELRHSNAGASIAGAKTVNIWKRAK